LLPRPQQVEYGSGQLALRDLSIYFASPPTTEDRFAAKELAGALSKVAGSPIAIGEGVASGKAIFLRRTGPVDALPGLGERAGPDSREAYTLKVTSGGVEIQARSSAGVYYGTQTLRQLVEGDGEQATLPVVEIHDWPVVAYRGTLVDEGSQGPQPTEDEIKRQIDFLARWKANQYCFYTEDGVELDGYPLLNPEARYTKEQVRRIIAYARERHMDVVPNLEFYGHQHGLFRVELYSELADFAHGEEFDTTNPKAMKLIADWVDQFTQLFPSPLVLIGFDETDEIGMAAERQGTTPAALFVKQLDQVAQLFRQRGKLVVADADMMVKYPEIAPRLPPGVMVAVWSYRPEDDPTYKRWFDPVTANHLPLYQVVTGVSSWNQIFPDFDRTFANIDTMLVAGLKAHAPNMLNTVWEDDQQNLMRMSWPGMAYGAAAPWQSAPMDRSNFFRDYAHLMYGEAATADVAAALDKLNRAEVLLQKVLGEDTQQAFWQDSFSLAGLKRVRDHREDLRQVRLWAEEAQQHLYRVLARGGPPATLSPLLLGGRLLDYAGMKGLYAVEIAEAWQEAGEHPTREQLSAHLGEHIYSRIGDFPDFLGGLREAYRQAWLAEYTPYRLDTALARWDAEIQYWLRFQTWRHNFMDDFHDGDVLPPIHVAVQSAR
jgi:hypothetical protein